MKAAYSFSSFSIDINLIQKRENKFNLPVVLIVLILIAMGGSIAFGWLWYNANDKLAIAQQQMDAVSLSMAKIETGLKENKFSGQISDVINQPALLEKQKPVTTQLLSQLNQLLPQYANVTQLDFNDQGTMNLSIYFATSEDIISFSQGVQGSAHFQLIKMGTITNNSEQNGPKNVQLPTKVGQITTLPVYQTTFELKYVRDGKGS